jgi:hypothetical protein
MNSTSFCRPPSLRLRWTSRITSFDKLRMSGWGKFRMNEFDKLLPFSFAKVSMDKQDNILRQAQDERMG